MAVMTADQVGVPVRQPMLELVSEVRPVALERSRQQRLDALENANDIRIARAALKRNIKGRRVSVTGLLLAPPAEILTMKAFDLLLARPGFGRVKVNKILTQCRISPSKTIGGMSERQRVEVVETVRRRERGEF